MGQPVLALTSNLKLFLHGVFCVPAAFPLDEDEGDEGDGEGDDAGHLGRFQAQRQVDVVATEEFQEEAFDGVEHDVQAEYLSFLVRKGAVKEKENKNQDIPLSFPDFGRPERLVPVRMVGQGRIGGNDAKIPACRMTEGVAVHEIGHAADGLAQDDGRRQEIGKGPGVDVMILRVEDASNGSE